MRHHFIINWGWW